MPRLACIIPALGNTESLETTLLSVLERRPDNCEVLVVLNTPYHDPYNLQGEIQFVQAPAQANLISCLNLGIAATSAPVVHLLANGWQADHGWIERALSHFDDPRVAAVAPGVYSAANENQLLASGVGYRCGGRRTIVRVTPESPKQAAQHNLGPLLQAAFFRKKPLEMLGGLPTELNENLVDIDLALSLRHTGWRIVIDPACRVFAPGLADPNDSGFGAAVSAERLFWRHAGEMGFLRSILAHPAVALAEIANSSPRWKILSQILGRLAASFELAPYRRYRLAAAASAIDAAAAASAWQELQAQIPGKTNDAFEKPQLRVDTPHKSPKPAETRQSTPARAHKARR